MNEENQNIKLRKSRLTLIDQHLLKKDEQGNLVAELELKNILRARVDKKMDFNFFIWELIGGVFLYCAHFLVESKAGSITLYVLGSLFILIGISSMTKLLLILERKGEALTFTIAETEEEAKAFAESIIEKKKSLLEEEN